MFIKVRVHLLSGKLDNNEMLLIDVVVCVQLVCNYYLYIGNILAT